MVLRGGMEWEWAAGRGAEEAPAKTHSLVREETKLAAAAKQPIISEPKSILYLLLG
jgi:hypothetical protein